VWRSALLWIAALVATLASATWQTRTGPTYPVRGEVPLGGRSFHLELERDHEGEGDQPVRIRVEDPGVAGEIAWRRFPTSQPWSFVPMAREGEWLTASLPHQPPAGKLEYQVRLGLGNERQVFPPRPAVTRFKGSVSKVILAPHVLFMFVGMLLSTRAGLEAIARNGKPARLTYVCLGCLVLGGLVLGPLVQHAAFGEYWTGVPFGYDLTDNKTLIIAIAWGVAAWRVRGGRNARWEILAAAAITLLVFVIPHSVWGSQIDWE
jgi:hypothetical protein